MAASYLTGCAHFGDWLHNGFKVGPDYIRVKDAKFQQMALKYQETVLRANAEVEDALIGFSNVIDELEFLKQSVEETLSTYDIIKKRVDEGAEEVFRLNEVQKDLVRRQENLAIAQANNALKLIRIYKALGGGWQIREQHHEGVFVGPELVEPQPLLEEAPGDAEPLPEPAQAELRQPGTVLDKLFLQRLDGLSLGLGFVHKFRLFLGQLGQFLLQANMVLEGLLDVDKHDMRDPLVCFLANFLSVRDRDGRKQNAGQNRPVMENLHESPPCGNVGI